MAANDEIPRGLPQVASRIGAGSAVTIIFPGTPGISWILTDVALTFAMDVGSSQNIQTWIDVTGALTVNKLIFLEDWFVNAITNSTTGSWSGQLAGTPGSALTLTVNGTQAANGDIQATASAYPI